MNFHYSIFFKKNVFYKKMNADQEDIGTQKIYMTVVSRDQWRNALGKILSSSKIEDLPEYGDEKGMKEIERWILQTCKINCQVCLSASKPLKRSTRRSRQTKKR